MGADSARKNMHVCVFVCLFVCLFVVTVKCPANSSCSFQTASR